MKKYFLIRFDNELIAIDKFLSIKKAGEAKRFCDKITKKIQTEIMPANDSEMDFETITRILTKYPGRKLMPLNMMQA